MAIKIKRIIYCLEDGSYKQIDGEELDNFVHNFETAHMCAVIHGHVMIPIKWQDINLEYDTAKVRN